ncbi:MAG TPA: CSLREA domain-containing protein, partial [Thermoanaerobaculia bacterium]
MTLRRAALLVLPVLLVSSLYAAPAEVQRSGPHIYLQESHSAPVAAAEKTLAGRSAEPLAVASADLNGDGAPELISTYATRDGGTIVVRRGNIDAFAPRGDAALRAIAEARFPAPFAGDATTVDVPVRPDFVVTGNFTGNASLDLAVASRASDEIYVFAGDGRGGFASPKNIRLAGPVTSLAAGDLERTGGYTNLVAGVSRSRNSSSLIIERGGEEGLEQVKEIFFNGAISALAVGDLDGDLRNDVAVLEGGRVSIVQSSTMEARSVRLPVSAVAMAIGAFVHDRDPRLQIALLSADGSIHIAARNGFDPRAFTADELAQMRRNRGRANALPRNASAAVLGGWQIIESFAGVAKFTDGLVPILLRTRISSRAADDVMVLNRAAGEMTLISHPNLATGAKSLIKGEVSKQPYSRTTVAAVPARVNIDGRPGVATIEKGETTPRLMMPLPDPTFTVNTTADTITPGACAAATPGACSLREAVIEANAAAGVDTIIVPAGTYTLTIPNVPTAADGENGALTGDLDILDGVNIVGAGSATTIVQAGLTAGTGIDKVFSINPNFTTAFATTLSGMTIRFGKNTASFATDGFGGAFDWEASGTGTLSVTDVIVDQNTTADGDGGGITLTNTGGGPGAATFSNVTVSNNTVQESSTGGAGIGGGIFIGTTTPVTLSNSTISTNHADQVAATSGQGGGIFLFGPDGATQSACHACTISGNTAAGDGGGILSGQSLTIDQLSSITGNTSGNNGGGLWLNHPGVTTTITKSTIAGNTATVAGGGIRVDTAATTALDMTFSRLAGNTAPTGNNLSNAAGTVNAPDNWWGTNVPAPTISGTVVFDPFIVLTHTASPTTLKVGDSSTLTADFLHDNHNAAIALANIPVLIGLPITFDNATNGTISAADTNIQST